LTRKCIKRMTFFEAFPEIFKPEGTLEDKEIISKLGIEFKILEALGITGNDIGYFIEPSLLKQGRLFADFYIECYSKVRFMDNEQKLDQLGMGISHAIFEEVLIDLRVPSIQNKPTIDRRYTKRGAGIIRWDFNIPGFGIIDVKSEFRYPNFSVSYNDWCRERPDWLVGIYIIDVPRKYVNSFNVHKLESKALIEKPTKAWLVGYMSREDVESRKLLPGKPRYLGDTSDRRLWLIPVKDDKWKEWRELERRLKEIARQIEDWKPLSNTRS